MSSLSRIEDMVDAFVAHAQTALPASIIQANIDRTVAAPALKKIEKAVRVDMQRLPSAIVFLESPRIEAVGQGTRELHAMVGLSIVAVGSASAPVETILERYLDAMIDLSTSSMMIPATEFLITAVEGDKGVEADGTRGYVYMVYDIWAEVPF